MAKRKNNKKSIDYKYTLITSCRLSHLFPFGCLMFNDLKLGVKCRYLAIHLDPKTKKAILVCKKKKVKMYGNKKVYKGGAK